MLLAGVGCGEAPVQRPTNLVLVVIDTLRADHLASYGYARSTSPNLDRFGSENLTFADARSQSACTSPSMSSLLTSRSPLRLLAQPRGHMGIPEDLPSLAEVLKQNNFWTVAISASPIVRRSPSRANRFGEFDRGFDVFDESCSGEPGACLNEVAARTLDLVTEPFFLYLHYMDVHGPYNPPADFERRFSEFIHQPQLLREGRMEQLQAMSRKYGKPITPEEIAYLVDLYDDGIAYTDERIGELLADLSRRGLLENSIIAIASDHGEGFGERGYLGHCRIPLFEGMVATPLFLRIPGVATRGRIEGPVQNLDIFPTVLDYLGIDTGDLVLEGTSLRAAIEGQGVTQPFAFSAQGTEVSVNDAAHTLILDLDDGVARLYDRQFDPEHNEDIAGREPGARTRLRAALDAWLEETAPVASAIVEDAGRLERELQALGYLESPADVRPKVPAPGAPR